MTPPRGPARRLLGLLACLLAAAASAGDGVRPHVHGAARLYVGLEGNTLSVQLETPLDNLLGFERAPRTERERAAVSDMVLRMRSGALFVPTPEADCTPDEAVLESDALGPAWLAGALPMRAALAPPKTHGPHADLDGSFTYICRLPAALRGMTVGLADAFRRIRSIEVVIATAKGQTRQTLRGAERQLRW